MAGPATPLVSDGFGGVRRPAFAGIVLTGGASRRMGTDKAFVSFRGRPLAVVARDALLRAGATEVVAVGGDLDRLAALRLRGVIDDHPGEGPLGGLLTGLRAVSTPVAVVLSCDLVAVDAGVVRRLLRALVDSDADVVVPVGDGGPQLLVAAWRVRARDALAAAFDAGERAPRRAIATLRVHELRGLPPAALVDVDSRAELLRYARG